MSDLHDTGFPSVSEKNTHMHVHCYTIVHARLAYVQYSALQKVQTTLRNHELGLFLALSTLERLT